MALLSEGDVVRFRHDHYDLLTRLFAAEPDAALLGALRDGLDDRAVGAAQVHRLMGDGWRAMAAHLRDDAAEALAEEFTRIFLGPMGKLVHPYESYYLTGRVYDQPLGDVRAFMARNALEPAGVGRREPEDGLAYELSVMARLVERQLAGGDVDPQAQLEPQREFLGQHLLVWAPACAAEIEAHPAAAFYGGAAQLLRGFLEVERDFFEEAGGLAVLSLDDARGRYHAPGFRGPIFDPEPPQGDPPTGGRKD
jgi:TorA maturation chaperone TorD